MQNYSTRRNDIKHKINKYWQTLYYVLCWEKNVNIHIKSSKLNGFKHLNMSSQTNWGNKKRMRINEAQKNDYISVKIHKIATIQLSKSTISSSTWRLRVHYEGRYRSGCSQNMKARNRSIFVALSKLWDLVVYRNPIAQQLVVG